jgi:hypothetical protein
MRLNRIEDPELDEDAGVVPIGAGGRLRPTMFTSERRRPWTPRDTALSSAPRHAQSPPVKQPGFSHTHWLMIASFVIICIGLLLGAAMVRLWDDASHAIAAVPPEGGVTPALAAGTPTTLAEPESPSTPQAAGAVTTEIRVLQPNYTVAPGDTLGNIARKHGTSVEALASINNLENRNSLGVGQKLIIP